MTTALSRALWYASGLWLALSAFVNSDAGVSIVGLFAQVGGAWVVGSLAVLRVVLGGRPRLTRQGLWKTAAGLVVVAVVLVPAPFSPFFRLRFVVSRPALSNAARQLLSTEEQGSSPRWVSLFRVERASAANGQVRFITTACGVVDACGLVFVESGNPRAWQEDVFTPLGGGWWRVHEGF